MKFFSHETIFETLMSLGETDSKNSIKTYSWRFYMNTFQEQLGIDEGVVTGLVLANNEKEAASIVASYLMSSPEFPLAIKIGDYNASETQKFLNSKSSLSFTMYVPKYICISPDDIIVGTANEFWDTHPILGISCDNDAECNTENSNVYDSDAFNGFNIEGNEAEALTDSYFELYQLLGAENMLKLYKHFHGDKIDCPMKLYRADNIADLASKTTDRKKRAEIARAGGYSLKFIESILQKRDNNEESN